MWLAYTLNPLTLTKVMPLIYQGEKDRMSLVIIWSNKSETAKRKEYKTINKCFRLQRTWDLTVVGLD